MKQNGIELGRYCHDSLEIVAVTSKTYSKSAPSRHSSGKRLMDAADVVLDNCGEIGDVAVKIPGLEQGLGPTSTITSAYLLHAVMVQATSNLSKIMKEPLFSGAQTCLEEWKRTEK